MRRCSSTEAMRLFACCLLRALKLNIQNPGRSEDISPAVNASKRESNPESSRSSQPSLNERESQLSIMPCPDISSVVICTSNAFFQVLAPAASIGAHLEIYASCLRRDCLFPSRPTFEKTTLINRKSSNTLQTKHTNSNSAPLTLSPKP